MIKKYEDIINLPHHVSKKHKQMTLELRAAQFAPFAALTGYDDEIKEAQRITNKEIELEEEAKSILNNKIQIILNNLSQRPIVSVTYFIPDTKKDGGKYVAVTDVVKKIDKYKQIIILENKTQIPINNIILITSDILEKKN